MAPRAPHFVTPSVGGLAAFGILGDVVIDQGLVSRDHLGRGNAGVVVERLLQAGEVAFGVAYEGGEKVQDIEILGRLDPGPLKR